MAANYTVDGSWNTTEIVGGSKAVAAQEFAIITKPSGVYFQFRRPVSQLSKLSSADRAKLVASIADQLSDRIEAVANHAQVDALSYSQPVNAAGQLLDTITIFYESTSGNSQGSFDVPMANIGPSQFKAIDTHVDRLDATEGL